MTQDEIIEMARQAGITAYRDFKIESFARRIHHIATAKEREACANLCQSMHKEWVKDELGDIGIAEPSDCSKAIRARGEV